MHSPSSILVLYDPAWTHIPTVREFLQGLQQFSGHRIFFSPAYVSANSPTGVQLDGFDAVVIHYSVRLTQEWPQTGLRERLRKFTGLKAAFLQDEYEDTEAARRSLEELQVSLVFTCVPPSEREKFYPAARFPNATFVQVFTGYVPLDLERRQRLALPLAQRAVELGYRGRRLGYWYGALAMEKWWIGRDAKAWCDARGVRCDISWSEADRFYGDEWFAFLGRCVATLGCESGANLIDEHGDVRRAVESYLQEHPSAEFEEVHAACLRPFDERTHMNQLSPRIFEAVAMRTALVLYPGEYSSVLRPHTHYFPLNKDGSNFDAVVNFLRDPAAVKAMSDRAYEDLIRSGLYGYEALARHFDEVADPLLRSSRSVSVWPVADIRPVAADGSPERLVLEAGHSDPAQVVAALRAGAPTSALLAHNSEFVVPRTRIGRTTVRRFTRVSPGSFEARFRQRLVVGVVDAPAIEMHLYARGKETAVFHTREERRQPLHAALADCVRLMSEGSVFDQPLRVKLSVQGVRQTLTMIVPEPWPTRTLKAAWHLLPLRWRLSPPAMRAKAALRALASPKPRPRQA